MNDILTDLLAIIGVVLNGLPQGLLALAYGFASVPTALAFLVGVVGNLATQSVAPISFQAETITYAGTAGKNRSERCTMIFIGGAIMTVIGLFGLLTKIVDFVGEDVAYGMMAGVGIILTKAAIDMIRNDGIAGGVSLVAALITYFFTKDSSNTLVYTIVISVVASCIASAIFKKNQTNIVVEDDKFIRQKFTINSSVIFGALGMVCLNIGSNISFGGITAGMATSGNYNVDHLTVISSVADMCSSFFGGAPVESIISAAVAMKAEAIHPGFGFLSENAKFAGLCEMCNIKFIGPSASVIEKMGNKSEARNTMMKAGVPVIPGTKQPVYDAKTALKAAKRIGFPVIIKASSGGGGKGIELPVPVA